MSKKILILYTSVGLGHKMIALNMTVHLEQAGYTVKPFDVLELQSGVVVTLGKKVHAFINQYLPSVWKWLYTSPLFTRATLNSRVKVAGKNYHKVKQVIDEFQPDLVITTQTSASAIIQYMKQQGMYRGLFVIGFSDYHLHRYWLYDSADLYLVNIEQQRDEMIKLGVPVEKIVVIGITLMLSKSVDSSVVHRSLNIPAGDKIVLVGSGSLGIGGLSLKMIDQLASFLESKHITLVIMTGKNQKLYETFKKDLGNRQNVKIVAYVLGHGGTQDLYAAAEMMLSKPGGLTVAETLQRCIPILITHWLPGQEELNYSYLTSRNLVIAQPHPLTPEVIAQYIVDELDNHYFRDQLKTNPDRAELVQSGREGQKLVESIQRLFHEV